MTDQSVDIIRRLFVEGDQSFQPLVKMPAEIKHRFESCRSLSKQKGCPPSIDDGLEIYGLLKQATRGDNNRAKPSAFNVVERAKWEAWTKKKGIPQDEAMNMFIETVRKAYSCSC